MKRKPIGTFEIVSGSVIVSDPCYKIGTWCQGKLDHVQNGNWLAFIEIPDDTVDDGPILRLTTLWDGNAQGNITSGWTAEAFEVGVDSGQAGVFDAAHYRDDNVVAGIDRVTDEIICPDEPWYSVCCDRTLSFIGAGAIPFGCVSSSGYGDGSYWCSVLKDSGGTIKGIRITFIK